MSDQQWNEQHYIDPEVLAALRAAETETGELSFARFMDVVLYGDHGYYTRRARIGGCGDFVTAASSPLLAAALFRYIERTWAAWGRPERLQVVEFGAGEGDLAHHLCRGLNEWLAGSEHSGRGAPGLDYVIIEASPDLRERQQRRLGELSGPVCVRWGQPDSGSDAVVIGNEVLDALPVERVRRTADGWARAVVRLDGDHLGLDWRPAPPEVAELCEAWLPVPTGTEAEICPLYPRWFAEVASFGRRLRALWLDYGITADEWRAGARPAGTVRAYRRHRLVDPLSNPGFADITADVHWDFAAAAAEAAGWTVRRLWTQGEFLIHHGVLDVCETAMGLPAMDRIRQLGALKQLILPGGMGERFSVLELSLGEPS